MPTSNTNLAPPPRLAGAGLSDVLTRAAADGPLPHSAGDRRPRRDAKLADQLAQHPSLDDTRTFSPSGDPLADADGLDAVRSRANQRHGARARPSVGEAALKGAVAGIIGGVALLAAERLGSRAVLPPGERAHEGRDAAEAIADARDATLSDAQAEVAGAGLELGACALLGAVFGVVQSRIHPPDLLHGLLLGGISWAATNSRRGVLPQTGAQAPPSAQSMERTAVPVASHVAYGIATAMAFDAMD